MGSIHKQGLKVLIVFQEVDSRKTKFIELYNKILKDRPDGIYSVDLLAIGSIDRSVHTGSGLKILVDSFNMLCSRILLRTQLDTVLRFFSIFLVDQPTAFALQILNGIRMNLLEDSSGNRLTDTYLVSRIKREHPWIPDLYRSLSNYVHFSNQHIFGTIQEIDEDVVTAGVYEEDLNQPETNWIEVVECYNKISDVLISFIERWLIMREELNNKRGVK